MLLAQTSKELTFKECVEAWIRKVDISKIGILKDEDYDEIVEVLHGNIQTHKNFRRWACKYKLSVLNKQTWLVRRSNILKKKKPSGRNVTKFKKHQLEKQIADDVAAATGPTPMVDDSSSS